MRTPVSHQSIPARVLVILLIVRAVALERAHQSMWEPGFYYRIFVKGEVGKGNKAGFSQ